MSALTTAFFDLGDDVLGSLFVASPLRVRERRALAKAMAVAWPIPLVEPVTRAVLPLRSVMRRFILSYKMGYVTHFDSSVLGCQTKNSANIDSWSTRRVTGRSSP